MRKKIKSGPTQIVLIVGHCEVGGTRRLQGSDYQSNTKPYLETVFVLTTRCHVDKVIKLRTYNLCLTSFNVQVHVFL